MGATKGNTKGVDLFDDDYKQAIDNLANAVAENAPIHTNLDDPFNVYVQQMHTKICSDDNHFKQRVDLGYRSLISELSKKDTPS